MGDQRLGAICYVGFEEFASTSTVPVTEKPVICVTSSGMASNLIFLFFWLPNVFIFSSN